MATDLYLVEKTPPWNTIDLGSSYSLNTTGIDAAGHGRGVAYLSDINHPFETNMFLNVNHMGPTAVPAPDIGSGWPAAVILLALVGFARWRRARQRARPRTNDGKRERRERTRRNPVPEPVDKLWITLKPEGQIRRWRHPVVNP
jgi:hypothetical protein